MCFFHASYSSSASSSVRCIFIRSFKLLNHTLILVYRFFQMETKEIDAVVQFLHRLVNALLGYIHISQHLRSLVCALLRIKNIEEHDPYATQCWGQTRETKHTIGIETSLAVEKIEKGPLVHNIRSSYSSLDFRLKRCSSSI
jgi:hypothetical protein